VLTHGFILDEERKKISKSSTYEKPQTSDAYIAEYGADVMRLWIASQNFRDDIPISKEILSHVGETYRLFRNTLRFQLSNLFDFNPARDAVSVERMDNLDRWALHQTAELLRQCTAAYDAYEFHKVYQLCNQFCAVTLSATYHDILKDRLYTRGAADPLRRSSQTALHHIFQTLVRILAPIITFTADEAWSFATAGAEYTAGSVHLQDWPEAEASWNAPELDEYISNLRVVKSLVNEKIEELRAAGTIGKSLQANVSLSGVILVMSKPFHIDQSRVNLPEFFTTSGVAVTTGTAISPESPEIKVYPTGAYHIENNQNVPGPSKRCDRCWRELPATDFKMTPYGEVCIRCANALPPRA
jgi:isoleucyl-tRNA synthetase